MAYSKVLRPNATEKAPPPAERIARSFKELATSSDDLNDAADELCVAVAPLNAALIELNIGVSAWHRIAGREDEDGNYWSRDLGYAKVGRKWGIALRRVEGNPNAEFHDEEVWLFADAPRWMQIESVGKIPDLFDELIKRTTDTARKLRAKTVEARVLAAALTEAISEVNGQEK